MSVRFLLMTLLSALSAGAIGACGAFATSSDPQADGSAPPAPAADAAIGDGPALEGAPPPDGAFTDASVPTDGPKVVGRVLFTTSETYSGNLGGLDGADAKCKAAALTAAFPPTREFRAWLSSSTSSATNRFAHDTRPIKSTRNEDFAPGGWPELASAVHATELLADEQANLVNVNFKVWTGTSPDGTVANAGTTNCVDWSSSTGAAVYGDGSQVDIAWTNSGTTLCSEQAHLYCLEK
jgi:hypothetical protein